MISQRMIDWGSQGCGIREIAAYGEARAAVVGAGAAVVSSLTEPGVYVGVPARRLYPDGAN